MASSVPLPTFLAFTDEVWPEPMAGSTTCTWLPAPSVTLANMGWSGSMTCSAGEPPKLFAELELTHFQRLLLVINACNSISGVVTEFHWVGSSPSSYRVLLQVRPTIIRSAALSASILSALSVVQSVLSVLQLSCWISTECPSATSQSKNCWSSWIPSRS
ncbi:hypothetical protein ES703_92615 [subsurface metagenome]